jgi:hypothetical protein
VVFNTRPVSLQLEFEELRRDRARLVTVEEGVVEDTSAGAQHPVVCTAVSGSGEASLSCEAPPRQQ